MHRLEDGRSLKRLADLASAIGSVAIEAEGRDLAARVSEGRFYLACVGQFKRGKSTILDALLGETVLPVGVVPVTAVPTIVRYGADRSARVRLGASEWRSIELDTVEDYVSEAENPGNIKNVSGIEVFCPSPLLADGMCFVDTPGIGSVFEVNTATTLEFIPRIDAALVVLGADPPVSGGELTLIQEISGHVDSLLFVMNKADRVQPEEMKAAKQFACRLLTARLNRSIEIYEVSARSELDSQGAGWEWPSFLAALERIVSASGRTLPRQAQRRSAERLAKRLAGVTKERKEALLIPLEESKRRLATLNAFMSNVEQSTLDVAQLLKAEQERSSNALCARRDTFLATDVPLAQALVQERVSGGSEQGAVFRRRTVNVAIDVARQRLTPWLETERKIADAEYRRTISRFNSTVEEYLTRLAGSGVPQLTHIADAHIEGGKLTAPSQFYFHKLLHVAEPASPFRILGDALSGLLRRRDPIQRDASDFVARVMETNAYRVEADLNHRLGVARKELEITVRRRLAAVIETAEDEFRRTREVIGAGGDAVHAELARLDDLSVESTRIYEELQRAGQALAVGS